MSTRLLQATCKWQRMCCNAQRFYFKPCPTNYDYATTRVPNNYLQRLPTQSSINATFSVQKMFTNHFATAVKENRSPKPPSLTALLEKLITQHQNFGQLNFELCDNVITQLERNPNVYNQLLLEDNAHFLLRASGTQMPSRNRNVRLQLFERLWTYLAYHSQLNAGEYLTRLHVLKYNRAPLADFRVFLQEFNQLNSEYAQPEIYVELLETLCEAGDIKQTTELLAEMREKGLPLTERHFNALILGNARNHDMAGCRTVLDNMAAAGIQPSLETQSLIVTAYIENEAPQKAVDLLKDYHGQFNAAQVMRTLSSLLYIEQQPEAEFIKQLVRELPKDFAEGIEVALPLRHLCIELLHTGKLTTVMHIIASLPTPRFNENQDIDTFCVFLLQELFLTRCEATQILEVAKMLQESEKNTRALHIVTEIALRRDAATALPFLKSLSEQEPLRPHYFWPLILQYKQQAGEAGLLNALREMQALNVTCDHETITQYILPYIPLTLQRPEQAIKALDNVGVKPSIALMYIIKYLLMNQRLDAAHDLLQLYPTKLAVEELVSILSNASVNVRATKRYHQFTKLLATLAKKNENQKVDWVGQLLQSMLEQTRLRSDLKALQRFIDEMVKFGLVISPAAAHTVVTLLEEKCNKDANLMPIKEALNKISDNSVMLLQNATSASGVGVNSSFVKHPRHMSLEELECHLNELEGKGMNARGVLRRLLQLCVRDGRLERALEVKAKCDKLGVKVSAGMLASTLDMYIKLKDLPNAEKTLQRLQQEFPAFPVDEHKFIDYAALLVHENQFEVAKNMLQLRAANEKINGGDYVIKNVWNFLTNVAKLAAQTPDLEPERNLTRETFHFLQKLRYCNAHNAVLGPIVRERLLRRDIKGAVAEFQMLTKQYKHTPLHFELTCSLVHLSNGHEPEVSQYADVSAEEAQQLLNVVTDCTTKVHGSINMNSSLLLAFAAAGTDNQLRRLLINPEFRINDDMLLKNCQHLGEEGAVETLLRLARGARGFGRVINEQNIYNMLLTHFAKANDYVAALDLYERLEADDDLKISQDFLRNLVHLLRVNNIEIPSRVALQAQIM